MPKIRNLLFFLFVGLALAGGAWAYLKLREIKKPSEDALQRLPAGCSIYLHTNDLFDLNNRLNTRSLIIDKFSELPPLSDILHQLEFFCKRSAEHPVLEDNMNDNGVHFAAYPEKKYWIICFNLKELGQEREFQMAFSETFKAKKIDAERYSFESEPKRILFMRMQKGSVCISNSTEALQAAYDPEVLRLRHDSAFAACSSGFEVSEPLNIYLSHKQLQAGDQSIGFNSLLSSGYTSGHFEVTPSQLILNGTLYPLNHPLFEALLSQEPSDPELQLMLPNSCVAFQAYGFQNFSLLAKAGPGSRTTQAFWKTVTDSALFEFQAGFYNNLTSTICEFSLSGTASPFVVLELIDTLKTREQLDFMSDSVLTHGNEKIYRLLQQKAAPYLFEPLSRVKCSYAFVYDTYLYCSENIDDARLLSQTMNAGNTFEKNEALMAYAKEQFPEEFSVLKYISPSVVPQSIKAFYPSAKKSNEENFQGLKHASLSLISLDNGFKLRWQCALEHEAEESGEKLLWTLALDTTCSMKPQEFVNHLSGEQELLVQDEANKLYLINSKGKVLWKKLLKEKIRSRIYRVDMFRNNKYQILFSTDNFIHLIDRNSNYVETYPIKAPAKISSPLCVFDYDANRDYRLFFACTNKKIYNYTIYGMRNERYSLVRTDEEVNLPIQYVKVGLSDYLIAIDREGKIYAISRKGELRLKLSNRTLVPCREIFIDASKNLQSTKLFYLDEKEGALHKISLTDKKEILSLKNETSALCYGFNLVDENRNMDLVMAGTEGLSAYNLNGNRLFDTKLPFELSEVSYYSDENHSVYYGWNSIKAELYLYEVRKNEGRSLKAGAMPLFSNLFKNNKIYLVYPEKGRLNCLAY